MSYTNFEAARHHVLRKLGEGGMGEVYLAEHVRMKRKSAIKVIHPSLATDAAALSRFNREAANACQILHPHVAAIFDFGETSDGMVYLAMEYVHGGSLADLLARGGALAIDRVVDLVRQIGGALDAAHRLGIVHRDLKPDNILITTDADGRDTVKVVDLGISKAAREGQTLTLTGQIVGTPDYMSPEQLSSESVDGRSDVYALAIVTFNALTGSLPFGSRSVHGSLFSRLNKRPRRLAEANPSLAGFATMQAVLDRAMELEPDKRHPTASAFADALVASRSITPVNLSLPVPSGLSPSDLASIEARLAKAVGPIARVLVKRAVLAAPTRAALVAALAQEIDDARIRQEFECAVG